MKWIVILALALSAMAQIASACAPYDRAAVARLRQNVRIGIGHVKVVGNVGRDFEVRLYHSDAPGREFATWRLREHTGPTQLIFKGKPINVGSDWGIQIALRNGPTSCVYPLHKVARQSGNQIVVEASAILEGHRD